LGSARKGVNIGDVLRVRLVGNYIGGLKRASRVPSSLSLKKNERTRGGAGVMCVTGGHGFD